jgi:hypothetical protein
MLWSYALAIGLFFSSVNGVLVIAFSILGLSLTGLWFAHLLAHSLRGIRNGMPSGSIPGRREVVRQFIRGMGTVALVTAVPALSKKAWAGNCSVSCANGTSSSNSCSDPQNCRCYCDGSGNARCDGCT